MCLHDAIHSIQQNVQLPARMKMVEATKNETKLLVQST